MSPAGSIPGPDGTRPGLRAAAIIAASGLTLFGMAGVSPALPAIERAFADVPNIGLLTPMVLTASALFIALSAPFAGLVIDRFGRKPVLIAALLAYLVTGIAPTWLESLPAILASRALLGLAVGMILTAATTLIGDFYRGPARNRMAGVQFAMMGVAMAGGTTVAGFLAETDWRLPFFMYAVAGLVLPLAWFGVREPLAGRAAHDDAPATGTDPPIPVFRIALIYVVVWISMLFTFLVPSQVPFLLPEIGVPEAGIAGVAVALFNIVTGMTALSFRRLRARLSNGALLSGCNFFLGAGLLLAATSVGTSQVLAGMLVAGLGFGLLMPTLNSWLLSLAPVARRGRLVGGLTFCQFLGFVASPFYSRPLAESIEMTGVFALTGLAQFAMGLLFAGAGVLAIVFGRRKASA